MRERLPTSIKDLTVGRDENQQILVTRTMLRHACNRTIWATGKSWDEVRECARQLIDCGVIAVTDNGDVDDRAG